jgi:glycerol kinase
MSADWKAQEITSLRVDGGMSASNITMQFMSDIVGIPIERPKILETTALGVAWLAGSYLDIYPDRKEFAKSWFVDKSYFPEMDLKMRDSLYGKWQAAIKSTLNFSENQAS